MQRPAHRGGMAAGPALLSASHPFRSVGLGEVRRPVQGHAGIGGGAATCPGLSETRARRWLGWVSAHSWLPPRLCLSCAARGFRAERGRVSMATAEEPASARGRAAILSVGAGERVALSATVWYMLRAPSRLGRWFWGAGLLRVLGKCARGHLPGTWHWVYDWLRVPVFLQGDFSPGRQEIRQFQVTVLDANSGSLGLGVSSRRDAPPRLGGRNGVQERDASGGCREGRRGQWVRTGENRPTQGVRGPGQPLGGQHGGQRPGSLALGGLSSNPRQSWKRSLGAGAGSALRKRLRSTCFSQNPVPCVPGTQRQH